jgi:hypothetical protein
VVETAVSRVINTQPGARRRAQLVKQIALALRTAGQAGADEATQLDLYAFMAMSLAEISASVEETVAAWEKRGYWVKADRFRLDWAWAQLAADQLSSGLRKRDFSTCAEAAIRLVPHVSGVKPARTEPKTPAWLGAWGAWSRDPTSGGA